MSEIKIHLFFSAADLHLHSLFLGLEAQHKVTLFSLLHQCSSSTNLQAALEEGHSTSSLDTPDMKAPGQVMTTNVL